jgi:hypothetical protein
VNYAELKNAIVEAIDSRTDLTDLLPFFIKNTEDEVAKLRTRHLEKALSDTISSNVIAVPSDYIELKHARVDISSDQWLERLSLDQMYRKFPRGSGTGIPRAIARDVGNFIFGPEPDSDYTILGTYYARPTRLAANADTNDLLTDYPNLYLFGGLREAAHYLRDAEKLAYFTQAFERQMLLVQAEATNEELSGSPLRQFRA